MAQTPRTRAAKAITQYSADDYIWGIPESPEFSVVHRLINEFKTHEGDEEQCLLVYRKIADETGDPLCRFLLNIIVSDEERHYHLIGRMIASLKEDLASTRARPAAAPMAISGATARELGVMLERFLDVERKGIRDCQRLKKTSQRFRQDLLALLCETIVYDSLKHIGILNFLRRKLREEKRPRGNKAASRSA